MLIQDATSTPDSTADIDDESAGPVLPALPNRAASIVAAQAGDTALHSSAQFPSRLTSEASIHPSHDRPQVVIVENNEGWRSSHRRAAQMVFGADVEIHEAADAVVGYELIQRLQQAGKDPFCLIDLHMDLSLAGNHPERNGDALIARLFETGLPRFAIVSGTLSNRRKQELIEGVGEMPFVSKDGLGAAVRGYEGPRAIERLKAIAEGDPPDLDQAALDYLNEVVREGIYIPQIEVLIDSIYGGASSILGQHEEELRSVPALELLRREGLSNLSHGNPSLQVHDWKNELAIVLLELQDPDSPHRLSIELLEKLNLLQSFVNISYAQMRDYSETVDVALATEAFCNRLNELSSGRIQFVNEPVPCLEIAANPLHLNTLIMGVLQNALMHGEGEVMVSIENNQLQICNSVPAGHQLSFSIIDNRVEGHLPDRSTSSAGSGTGIRAMLEQVHQIDGAELCIVQEVDVVITSVQFDAVQAESIQRTDAQSQALKSEPEVHQLNNVIFLCHDGISEATFQTEIQHHPPSYNAMPLNAPRSLDLYTAGNPGATNEEREAEAELFLEQNSDAFSNACLCMVHTGGIGGLAGISAHIERKYPQIMVIPVSNNRGRFYDSISDTFLCPERNMPSNILTVDRVRKYIHSEDPATFDEVVTGIYYKHTPERVWQTFVAIAHRIALDRTAATESIQETSEAAEAVASEATHAPEVDTESDVVFLCHHNEPDFTYDKILKADVVEGFSYQPLEAPHLFEMEKFLDRWKGEIDQFLEEHAATLSKASLCVIHTPKGGFATMLHPLQERFPHLVLLPVTSSVPGWYRHRDSDFEQRMESIMPFPGNMLTQDDFERYGAADDPVVSPDDLYWELGRAAPTPEVWELILKVAKRKSEALRSGGTGNQA